MTTFSRKITAIVGLTLLSVVAVFPVAYALLLAFQNNDEATSIPPTIFPSTLRWQNFLVVSERIDVPDLFMNSLVYSATTTVMVIITALLAGYAVAKLRIPGKRLILASFVGAILIPPAVRAIPLYTMIARLDWVDTWAGLSMPLMATGFGLFFFHQYMLTIPDSFLESARIDGCREPQIMWRIVAPLARPGIFTLMLYNFLFRWNGYLWPLVVTRDKWTTLPVGISVFKTSEQLVTWNLIAAAAVITLIPVLLLFAFVGRRIIYGLALQASK